MLSSIADHEPDLVEISKEVPLIRHPMTRELEVVIEVIEQGPKARMPLTWFMEAPVPALAKDQQESKTDALLEGTPKASPEQLRGAAEMLRISAAAAPSEVLGHGHGPRAQRNLTAFPSIHQFGATPGSMLGAPIRNNRELSTLDSSASAQTMAMPRMQRSEAAFLQPNVNSTGLAAARLGVPIRNNRELSALNSSASAPMMAMPRMQHPEAAFIQPNANSTELAAARFRAREAVDANMSALAAVHHRAHEAVATLQAIQKKEMAFRLAQQGHLINTYQTNYDAGIGASVQAGILAAAPAANSAAMQSHERAMSARMPSGPQPQGHLRRTYQTNNDVAIDTSAQAGILALAAERANSARMPSEPQHQNEAVRQHLINMMGLYSTGRR